MDRLKPTSLTWAALLSRWMDFARAGVSFPDDHEGRAWRESIASIIRLQAVTFALGEIDRLPTDEQLLAIDKSELLIAQSNRLEQRILSLLSNFRSLTAHDRKPISTAYKLARSPPVPTPPP